MKKVDQPLMNLKDVEKSERERGERVKRDL